MNTHIATLARRGGLAALVAGLMTVTTATLAAPFANWGVREQRVLTLVNEQRAHHGRSALAADARLHEAAIAHSGDMLNDDFFAHKHPDGTTAAQRATAAGYRWTSTGENIAAGSGRQVRGASIVESAADDAARDVMFGTDELADLAGFAAARGLGAAAGLAWSDVGRGWSAADWEAWDQRRSGRGGWMGSTGHRGSILSDRFADIGIGYVYSSTDQGRITFGTYWTQQFAAGDSETRPAPEPEPEPEPTPEPEPEPNRPRNPAVLLPILDLIND